MNKYLNLILSLCAIFLVTSANNAYADIPVSSRSKEVVSRVSPKLKLDFENKGLKLGNPLFIRIFKETNELEVWIKQDGKFELFKTYPICYYSGDLGPKLYTGDGQSPEGFYTVKPAQLNPSSSFHLSFNIGYPNSFDKANGRIGSAIMVHGNCVSIGCYAMTNPLIEEIYTIAEAAFRKEQLAFDVHIFPFRMTDANLSKKQDSKWYPFWLNLKLGYDIFEKTGLPPQVRVKDKIYSF